MTPPLGNPILLWSTRYCQLVFDAFLGQVRGKFSRGILASIVRLDPHMSSVVINKCNEVFTPTKWLGSNLPTHITVYQLKQMIYPFSSGLLEGQPVTLSFNIGFTETRLLFPVEVQPTDHFVLCQHLYSLNSQVAKLAMPNCFLRTVVIRAWTGLVDGISVIKVTTQTSFSVSRGYKFGLRISDFTSHLREAGHLAFLRGSSYAEMYARPGTRRTSWRVQLFILPCNGFIVRTMFPRPTPWRFWPPPNVMFNGLCKARSSLNIASLLHMWHVTPESMIHWPWVLESADKACWTTRPVLSPSEQFSSSAVFFLYWSGLLWPLTFTNSSLEVSWFIAKMTPRFLLESSRKCLFLAWLIQSTFHLCLFMQQLFCYHCSLGT